MKEYSNGGSTAQEQYFGLEVCQSCMAIECSFGRLKDLLPLKEQWISTSWNCHISLMHVLFCTISVNWTIIRSIFRSVIVFLDMIVTEPSRIPAQTWNV